MIKKYVKTGLPLTFYFWIRQAPSVPRFLREHNLFPVVSAELHISNEKRLLQLEQCLGIFLGVS